MSEHKPYTAADIRIVTSEWLRETAHDQRTRQRFLTGSPVDEPEGLAAAIAVGIGALGGTRTVIEHRPEWTVISADIDWLESGQCRGPVPSYFERGYGFPELSVNEIRPEVFVGTFATRAVTATPSERRVVVGSVADDDSVWDVLLPEGAARSLAFSVRAAT